MKKWVFMIHQLMTVLILLGIMIEFYFAGLGIFHAQSFQLHMVTGEILWGASLALFVISLIGMIGRKLIGFSLLLFVLLFIQPLLVQANQSFVQAIHLINALLIFAVTLYLMVVSFRQSKTMVTTHD